jgi:hypothetical protein
MSPGKIAVVAVTFACTTLLSVGWSGQHGVSLSVERAQAQANESSAATPKKRVSHVATPKKQVADVSHRRHWRAAQGYSPNPVAAGAGLAAGAVNTAGAVAAGAINTAGAIATAPFGGPYPNGPYAGPGGHYASSAWGDYDCRPGAAGCRPYASKDWSR